VLSGDFYNIPELCFYIGIAIFFSLFIIKQQHVLTIFTAWVLPNQFCKTEEKISTIM